MKCPACGNALKETTAGAIKVNVCAGSCGGLWFDWYELRKVDEPHEGGGKVLDAISPDTSIEIAREKRRRCPKCEDVIMVQHYYSMKFESAVDECPKCGGHWLDLGELAKIRARVTDESEQKKAADKYFTDVCDVHLAKLRKMSEDKREVARRIASAFRFISPANWFPKKYQS